MIPEPLGEPILESRGNGSRAPVPPYLLWLRDEIVARIVWFFDDVICHLEAAIPVDIFDGR